MATAQKDGTKTSCTDCGVCPGNDSTLLPRLEKNVHGRRQNKLKIMTGTLHFLEEYAKQVRRFELYFIGNKKSSQTYRDGGHTRLRVIVLEAILKWISVK